MTGRRAVVAGLVVAILLVAGALAVVLRGNDDDGGDEAASRRPTATTEASPATTVAGTPGTIEAVVPQLQEFVERQRGLKYKAPVQVTLLADDAFRARLRADESADVQELRDVQAVLRAVGLLDHDVDLQQALQSLTGDLVAGFYDPKSKQLVVRGATATPYVRQVLVHELTHALEDQWFGLERPDIDKADSEAQAGFEALTEGSAVVVEQAYHGLMPDDDRRAADREEERLASGADPDLPAVLLASISFPYERGPLLVRTLLAQGGPKRLDEAFRSPPRSTEQVIHPERYLNGDVPKAVAEPRADRTAFEHDVIGELSLLQMLEVAVPLADAQRAAQGWGGDRFVAWRDGSRTCVRATFVMDTPQDTTELVSSLNRYAARRAGTTVEGTGPVTVTTCG